MKSMQLLLSQQEQEDAFLPWHSLPSSMDLSLTNAEIERLQSLVAERRQTGQDWPLATVTDSDTVVVSNNGSPNDCCYHKNHDGEPACVVRQLRSIHWGVHPRDSPARTIHRPCLRCYPDGDPHVDADSDGR